MSQSPIAQMIDVVGDPTNGGTLVPPDTVQIPWAVWQAFVNQMKPPADPKKEAKT